jgi:hypothetical protein
VYENNPIPTTWPCKKFRSTNKAFGMSRVDKPNMMVNNQEGRMSFKNLISTTWAKHGHNMIPQVGKIRKTCLMNIQWHDGNHGDPNQ